MSFAVRNSLVLGILLFLIMILGGYWTSIRQPEKLRKIEDEIKKVDLELVNTPDLLGQYNIVHAELEKWETRWNQRSKDIPHEDVTGETNAYLNSVILASGRVKVDVQYTGAKQESNYGYNTYTLKGEAAFYSMYRFIWYLENARRLFKLNRLNLRGVLSREPTDEQAHPAVQFDMEVRAFFTPLVDLSSAVAWRDMSAPDLASNPFWPLIRADLPPNAEGLVDVDRSELKAVIPGKAFVNDQNGKLWGLTVGDKVYLGYVSKISPEDSKVEFLLNKGGVSETVVLKVRYRQSPKEGIK